MYININRYECRYTYTHVYIYICTKMYVYAYVWIKKYIYIYMFSSIQFSHSVMSDFLQPHESQHTRPPCPSQTPGVHSDSCPLSQ